MDVTQFWEARAQRFAGEGAGLRAVCSYAMPNFYNWAIDVTQRAALAGLLRSIRPGDDVLDYGCGVGRWSREAARRGARVTGIDFSATMIAEARRRTTPAALAGSCRFEERDVTTVELDRQFDVILGVTVLQHVLDDAVLAATIGRLARHLRPGGRLVLFEVAPSARDARCDTKTFHARTLGEYVAMIEGAGLRVDTVRGVDPLPCKLWVIPRFRRWPTLIGVPALALATAISLPLDLLLGRGLVRRSWHKIIVASTRETAP